MTEASARKPRALTSERVKTSAPANRIVEAFGGLSRFCELCDFAVGTVHGWQAKGLVPAKTRVDENGGQISYMRWIIARGQHHGIPIGPADFLEISGSLDG